MNPVDTFYKNTQALISFLDEQDEVSFRSDVDNSFKKVLVLSAASYFEERIKELLNKFIAQESNNSILISEFLNRRAIADKYFQLFDWEKNTANKFYSLFGNDFKNAISNYTKNNMSFDESTKAFLEIGNWRNILVHNNFVDCDFPKTGEEVFDLFNKAKKFPEELTEKLSTYPTWV